MKIKVFLFVLGLSALLVTKADAQTYGGIVISECTGTDGKASISIFDATGKLVESSENGLNLSKGQNNLNFDVSKKAVGIYFYKIKVGDDEQSGKFVKQ